MTELPIYNIGADHTAPDRVLVQVPCMQKNNHSVVSHPIDLTGSSNCHCGLARFRPGCSLGETYVGDLSSYAIPGDSICVFVYLCICIFVFSCSMIA
jgi:hypothetical protein